MRRGGFAVVIVLLRVAGHAQVSRLAAESDTAGDRGVPELEVTEYVEPTATSASGDADLLDHLNYLREHPYDLNTVSLEELQSVPGIMPAEALAVIDLRRRLRRIQSISQLALIPEGGEFLTSRIAPFVTALRRRTPAYVVLRSRASFSDRDPPAAGPGPLSDLCEHVEATVGGRTTFGLLYSKRTTEELTGGFTSGYVEMHGLPIVSDIVIGDYTLQCGQGLVLWSDRSTVKGSSSVGAVRRVALGLRSSTTTSRSSFLRGVAVAAPLPVPARFCLFVSRRPLLGADPVSDDVSGLQDTLGSIQVSGGEEGGGVVERLVGARVSFSPGAGMLAGVTGYRSGFSIPIRGAGDPFRTGVDVGGIDLLAGSEHLHFFGEAAWSTPTGSAFLLGFLVSIPGSTTVAFLWRRYSPEYFNPHASGFREFSGTANERGFHASVEIPLSGHVRLGAAWDQFHVIEGRNLQSVSPGGSEVVLRAAASVDNGCELTVRVASEQREEFPTSGSGSAGSLPPIGGQHAFRIRVGVTYSVLHGLELSSRAEEAKSDGLRGAGRSSMVVHGFRWRVGTRFHVAGRLAYFGRERAASTLYDIENDLGGVYGLYALSGSGRRVSLMVRWEPAPWMKIGMKFSMEESERSPDTSTGTACAVRARCAIVQCDVRL